MKHFHKKTTQIASDKERDITDRKGIVNLLHCAHFPRKWSTLLAYVQSYHTEFYPYRKLNVKHVDKNLFTTVNNMTSTERMFKKLIHFLSRIVFRSSITLVSV